MEDPDKVVVNGGISNIYVFLTRKFLMHSRGVSCGPLLEISTALEFQRIVEPVNLNQQTSSLSTTACVGGYALMWQRGTTSLSQKAE